MIVIPISNGIKTFFIFFLFMASKSLTLRKKIPKKTINIPNMEYIPIWSLSSKVPIIGTSATDVPLDIG